MTSPKNSLKYVSGFTEIILVDRRTRKFGHCVWVTYKRDAGPHISQMRLTESCAPMHWSMNRTDRIFVVALAWDT